MSRLAIFGILFALTASLSSCASNRFEIVHTQPCSSLVPVNQQKPTPGADLPKVDGDGSWFDFGMRQSGQLDKSNNRYDTSLDIIKKCEERDRSAILVPKQKVIGISVKKK